MASTPRARRRAPRRSSEEIREPLLAAARQLFETQGYQATTTQQIVDEAAVDAPSLYRHFRSKAHLFEAAMLGSLQHALADHATYWSSRPPGEADPDDLIHNFATGLVQSLHKHRAVMRTLLAASDSEDDLGEIARRVRHQLTQGLIGMKDILVAEQRVHRWAGLDDPSASMAAITGMILSLVLFDDWVLPGGRRIGRARLIDEVSALVLYGITQRPARS